MNQHFLRFSLAALAATTLSVPSWAQESDESDATGDSASEPGGTGAQDSAEDDSAPARKMHLSVAAPDAPVQRTDFLHEGFYFRAGAGAGFLTTTVSDKNSDASNNDVSFSLGSDVRVGGSPAPGLALGLGGQADVGFAQDPSLAFLAGPFFDAHPYNRGGWHLGALVGFAGTSLGGASQTTLLGGGASLFGGHDIWIAPEWSLGLGTRVSGSRVMNSDFNATNFSLHFLITILNH